MEPKFSIIVPVYNTEKYIDQCIDSILKQTEKSFEVILVDDGSTDSCSTKCDKYAEKYDCIHVVHQKNQGLLLARRAGINASKGRYLVHVDSDDMIMPDLLHLISEKINKTEADLVIYGYYVANDSGRIISEGKKFFENHSEIITKEEYVGQSLSKYEMNGIAFKCAKREIAGVGEDYSEYGHLNMGEDALQSAALIEGAKKIAYLENPVYVYRKNSASISKNIGSKHMIDFMKVRKRTLQMINNLNLYNRFASLFYRKYIHDFNRYVMKCLIRFNKKVEYAGFRKEVMSYELKRDESIAIPLFEKILYSLGTLNSFYYLKPIIKLLYMKKRG